MLVHIPHLVAAHISSSSPSKQIWSGHSPLEINTSIRQYHLPSFLPCLPRHPEYPLRPKTDTQDDTPARIEVIYVREYLAFRSQVEEVSQRVVRRGVARYLRVGREEGVGAVQEGDEVWP